MRLSLFWTTFLITFLLQISVAFIVDPLEAFRRATWYRPEFSGNETFYLPGLIKYYDYDVALVGSSVAQNTSANQVNQVFKGKTLKITISGLHGEELGDALRLVLSEGKARIVLINLDMACFHGLDAPRRDTTLWPKYAYSTDIWSSWPYLLNVPNVWPSLIKTLVKNLKSPASLDSASQEWDRLWAWEGNAPISRTRLVDKWRKMIDEPKKEVSAYDLKPWLECFDSTVINAIKAYPKTQFYLYLPPYSILYWNGTYLRGNIDRELAFKRKMLEKLLVLPNVQVFDFQDDANLIWNLNHYYDLVHFDSTYNAFEISHLLQNQYRVTPQILEGRLANLRDQASHCAWSGSEIYWKQ